MTAPNLEITRAIPLYPNGVFLQWDMPFVRDTGTYLFDVFRAGSPDGPWEQLVTAAANIYNYTDRWALTNPDSMTASANQLSILRGVFYRVDVTPPSGAADKVSVISEVEPQLTPRFKAMKRKMLRDESVAMHKLNGTEIAILKRRRWGARCPSCYDPYTQETTRADCIVCFGTSFTGGYFDPIITVGRRAVVQNDTAMTPEGTADVAVSQMWLLDAPYVEADDIVIGLRDNRRFLITKVRNTELQTVTVHQKVDITEIPRSSIEYRVTVDPTRTPPLF